MEKVDISKHKALLDEFETANKLLKLGLGELQNISLNNDFYFLPFQLLSQSFERFMKAYICLGHLKKHKSLPKSEYIKKLGHDLEKLLIEIQDNYYCRNHPRFQFEIDSDFLNNNVDLKELLYILSEFGKIARYHNFDIITGSSKIGINPKENWQRFENRIVPIDGETIKKLMNRDVEREVYQKITNHIIIVFEKFVSSLSRQIIFNTLGQIGQQLTINSFYNYGLLYEGDFGKTDYRKNTSKYRETPKRTHKRNFIDKIRRKYHSHYKSKKISSKEYAGDWPFYAEEVIIECREKHWCIVTINNYDYALNGSAKGRYNLNFSDEAGMSILGKSTSDFIKMAKELN